MWSPLAETREEGWRDSLSPPIPGEEERTVGLPLPDLAPGDWMILGKCFERKTAKQIAAECSMSVAAVRQVLMKPAFKAAVQMVEASIAERIARGEFGVLAIAKANAVGAFRRLVGMAKGSEDERIKFQANVKILEMAGIKPATPIVTESPERLIDAMTAEEAEKFAASGEFPDRFRDQLARLATSVLEKSERARWEPQVDAQPLTGTEIEEEPRREKPREIEEGEN